MKQIEKEIEDLKPWFHNLHLPDGTQTSPEHPLGDFPKFKWELIAPFIPSDLSGVNVLDIGCNAGYYSFQLARLGAKVTAIDIDEHFLKQALWASKVFGLEKNIEFKKMQVYDLAHESQTYDLIWFMGVFYHLRYPLLAMDIISRISSEMMVFQTLKMPGVEQYTSVSDLDLFKRETLLQTGWPKMAFIEERVAGDPTNWWVPNGGAIEAMLRSSNFTVNHRPDDEIFVCSRNTVVIHEEDMREKEYRAAAGIDKRN
ncbi:TIGR04290 family methyltransferase [Chitinispirillales bacterium ANBcel5]|uniref:TIGR04290 family methyltransferase n=1 Tax=Cellulosispirillum alkaliphilum TaxID=3039283 RepID=UPI002A4EE562|nr:TIGR04290 family methyltransferase [Chitinispirillales bacterium ANBcel5]